MLGILYRNFHSMHSNSLGNNTSIVRIVSTLYQVISLVDRIPISPQSHARGCNQRDSTSLPTLMGSWEEYDRRGSHRKNLGGYFNNFFQTYTSFE